MQKLNYLIVSVVILLFLGCNKNSNEVQHSNAYLLSVYLSDNPADLEEVNIDIHSVEVKIDTGNADDEQQIALLDTDRGNDSLGAPGSTLWHGGIPVGDSDQFGKWIALDFKPGVYDILKLRNGTDTLLGSVEASGIVRKIRIALGSNNHVTENGSQFPLKLQDDSTNHHIYIDILKESRVENSDGSMTVYLDFDLGRSVKKLEDQYILSPYIRTLPADRSLEIEGYAFPAEAPVVVNVYNDKDTAAALPDGSGYFKIKGLPLGRYYVAYQAGNAYRDTTTVFDITKNKITLPPMTLVAQ